MTFKDTVIVVTGGTRGIGWAIANGFAQQGATLALCATKQDAAKQAADTLSSTHGIPALGAGVNVTSFDDVSAFIGHVLTTFGRIDVLINNAGITRDNLLLRMGPSDWDDVIQTNLTGIFNTTKAVIRPMVKQKYGRIINMTSVVGIMGNAGQANYAAAKSGMIGFTKSIAREYGKKNITTNAIAPGFIQTDMTDALPNDYLDNIIKTVPMSRIGQPDDVFAACQFLASKEASYINGQVLNVDGGLCM